MSDLTHVSDGQLVRAIDGEMTAAEHAEFEAHLVRCDACLERYEALAEFSNEIERAIDATPVQAPRGAREQLVEKLAGEQVTAAVAVRRIPRWWWAPAIAASAALLFFALLEPKQPAPRRDVARHEVRADMAVEPAPVAEARAFPVRKSPRTQRKAAHASGNLPQIAGNGETSFIPLPYVDAAQPMPPAGLVRVQMRLSMLANAGVIRMMPGASDEPVQADLLLGPGGQPYAVRLVSASQ